jgi:hypothetical protein
VQAHTTCCIGFARVEPCSICVSDLLARKPARHGWSTPLLVQRSAGKRCCHAFATCMWDCCDSRDSSGTCLGLCSGQGAKCSICG